MKITSRFGVLHAFVFLFPVCSLLVVLQTSATAQDEEYVVAELGGVKVVSVPQPSPARGLLATKVVVRTAAENKLVTFENVKISGDVHQVFIPGSFGGPPQPTPVVDSPLWNVLPPDWIAADSHILISPSMVAGEAGGGLGGIAEVTDLSNPVNAAETLPWLGGQAPAVTGIGDLKMAAPTDAFFLRTDLQTHEIELARVVTPEAGAEGAAGEVFLTVGVLGDGIINSGQPGGASFGFHGNEPVAIFSFVPEPATGLMASIAFLALLGLRRMLVLEEAS